MRADKLFFEKRYSDDSGVEFGVSLNGSEIEFEAINKISFPIEELPWLIKALHRIADEVAMTPITGGCFDPLQAQHTL